MKRAHIWISGKVQGVWFRAHTKEKADELKIKGMVRNASDGKVEAIFEGPDQKVDDMITWCHTGSPQARVKHVDIQWEDFKNEFDAFTIWY